MQSERYTIIEQLDLSFRVVDVVLEGLSRIHIMAVRSVDDIAQAVKHTYMTDLTHLDLFRAGSRTRRVVLALDPDSATTVTAKITVPRVHQQEPIREGELDYLVFKGLWSFLSEYREWAAKKMKVTDADMVLANVSVSRVFLDGSQVLTPIGFKGKECTLQLVGTFVPRNILPLVEQAHQFGRQVMVIERASAISSLLGRSDIGLHIDRVSTQICAVRDTETKFVRRVMWGIDTMVKPVAHEFAVNMETARAIVERYLNSHVSKQMGQLLDTLTKKSRSDLQSVVRTATRRRSPRILVNIPGLVFNKVLRGMKGVEHMDFVDIAKQRGFNVMMEENDLLLGGLQVAPDYLLLISSNLFSQHYELLNHMLQRRSRWLIPHM